MKSSIVFVTVGTTKFDKLIKTILCDDILNELNKRGYNHLILQIGNTTIEPDCTPRCGFTAIEVFKLKPSLEQYMTSADLVISHAGAGSCLEALEAKKPLIVVINDLLMDNHQYELAEQLCKDNHLYQCTCDTLLELLKTMDLSKLQPFINNRSKEIAQIIDHILGYS
ncbi:UDP-N-acetylglucosamine transferase subunit ALG13 homolog [Chelonus insularis]|uniref:UDP-N-acetylglucosamine transferase subunit ALG13 homolog n=1 Tax=Chelonus insularis TaxID=460826 RepID=UPI001589BFFC|nr:UDP-N-acetylglucosamine transferase subunit ALG13 homolog [Chelonus insularis]